MNKFKKLTRLASLIALLIASASVSFAQTAPAVLKVDPPNWWIGHSINPVRVLIRGRGFHGARVEAVGSGLKTGLVRVSAAGTYIFVDVVVDPQAKAGRRSLRITTPGGQVETPFEILEPLSRVNRFQGFSPDDVLYLIMIDRFADGDRENNDPPQSRGLYARAQVSLSRRRFTGHHQSPAVLERFGHYSHLAHPLVR